MVAPLHQISWYISWMRADVRADVECLAKVTVPPLLCGRGLSRIRQPQTTRWSPRPQPKRGDCQVWCWARESQQGLAPASGPRWQCCEEGCCVTTSTAIGRFKSTEVDRWGISIMDGVMCAGVDSILNGGRLRATNSGSRRNLKRCVLRSAISALIFLTGSLESLESIAQSCDFTRVHACAVTRVVGGPSPDAGAQLFNTDPNCGYKVRVTVRGHNPPHATNRNCPQCCPDGRQLCECEGTVELTVDLPNSVSGIQGCTMLDCSSCGGTSSTCSAGSPVSEVEIMKAEIFAYKAVGSTRISQG